MIVEEVIPLQTLMFSEALKLLKRFLRQTTIYTGVTGEPAKGAELDGDEICYTASFFDKSRKTRSAFSLRFLRRIYNHPR